MFKSMLKGALLVLLTSVSFVSAFGQDSKTTTLRTKIIEDLATNNSRQITAEKLRSVLISSADAIDTLKSDIDKVYTTFSLGISIGEYDASSGVAKVTATGATSIPGTTPAFPDGKYFDVVKAGSSSITGAPVNMIEGGKIIVRGSAWGYIPPSDLALTKISVAEPKIETLQSQTSKLTPTVNAVARVQQSSTYGYIAYSNFVQKTQSYWFFGKSLKQFNKLGVFVFKRSSTGTIVSDVRVQLLRQRGATHTILMDRTIAASTLSANDDVDAIAAGTLPNYEVVLPLASMQTVQAGDVFFISIFCDSGLNPIYAETNKADVTGEWNNGVGNYYRVWTTSSTVPTYTTVPGLPAAETNPGAIHFYEDVVELSRVKALEDRTTTVETTKATATQVQITGNQLFNKAAHVVTGQGIGSDGVVFTNASFGSVTMPISAGRQFVLSGMQGSGGRGLRFEQANGTLISFIGQATNNTAYTTPAGTGRMSFQLWSSSTPGHADSLMVNYGTSALPRESYTSTSFTNRINAVPVQAESLAPGTKMGGLDLVTKDVSDVLSSRITTVETTKATVSTEAVVGAQLFNKAAHVITAKGVGLDGVIFNSSNYGMVTMPIAAGKQFVFSGLQTGSGGGRGLRYEQANGTLISLVGQATNNTAYTTPSGTGRISFQLWSSSTPGYADSLMVNYGTTALPRQAYTVTTYTSQANATPFLATAVKEGATMAGIPLATKQDLDAAASGIGSLDFTHIFPANIYVPSNEIGGLITVRREPTLMYLQHFIREKIEVTLSGKNYVVTSRNDLNGSSDAIQESYNYTLGGGRYLVKSVTSNRISVKSSLGASVTPIVGLISDSYASHRGRNGVFSGVGAGTVFGMAKEISEKNRIDNGGTGYNYVLMGRTNQATATTTYKSQSISFKQYADAAGGWAAFTWLRHPCRLWVTQTTATGTSGPAGGWDLLGLSTTQGRAYSGSEADKLLIAKTCYGVNAPVISAASYTLLANEGQISSSLGAWTGSSPQIALVQAWIDAVANGTSTTINQYFDITKTGTNRFNFTKYYNEWKTLAADGVTRLVVGSTAGTKVTDINAVDVTVPTHYLICLGENDGIFYNNPVANVDDVMELATEIRTQLPSCHVGVYNLDMPGPMFPDRHPNYLGTFSQTDHNRKYDFYKELQTRFGSLASQKSNKTWIIPTWFFSNPLSHSVVAEQTDEGAPNNIIQIGNNDTNHNGYYGNRSAGIMIYGWVLYTYVP